MGDALGGAWDWTKGIAGDAWSGVKEIPIVGDALGMAENALTPADTSLLNQTAADSRALTQMFMAQQGKLAPVPGLVGPGYDTPTTAASAPGAAPSAMPTATAAPAPAPTAQPALTPLAQRLAEGIGGIFTGAKAPSVSAGVGGVSGTATGAPPPGGAVAPAPAPGAPGLDPRQQAQFREGQLALASSIGQSLGAAQPGAPMLDETRALEARDAQMGLAGSLRDAMAAGPSATPTLDQARQLEARGRQLGAISQLEDAAAGRVPSVAEMQGTRQIGNLQSNIMGNAAAQARGGNTALALRSALSASGRLGGDAVANAAMQRAQEQAMARGQLVGALENLRGADIGVAGQDLTAALAARGQNITQEQARTGQLADLLQGTRAADLSAATANQQSQLANRAQNIQETTAARGQLADVLQAGRGTDVNIASQNQQSQIATRGQNITQEQNQAGNVLQANANQAAAAGAKLQADIAGKQQAGNLLSTGAGIAAMSDRRAKEDIKPAPTGAFREFLGAVDPSRYRYKGRPEPKVGVMAQDLERSEVGDTIVRDTPDGKVIDIPSATGALIAALADVHRRVNRLEGRG